MITLRALAKNLSYTQKSCVSKAGKLMFESRMLSPGARVGVAMSGGLDSWVLLLALLVQKRKLPFDLELMVLHVNPGFDSSNHFPLLDWVERVGLPVHVEVSDMGPRAHSSENRKNSPCFFCSWLRRKRLFELMSRYRLTHLAMGHNADDLVQTFFMNLCYAGRVEGIYPRETFFGGEFELIRPLLWVDKRLITKAAREWDLPVWSNPCPSAGSSKRSDVDQWLEALWTGNKRIRKNIFSALMRWQAMHPSPSNGREPSGSDEL
jgi:tRNA(Ile)-lysidine synthase TilS/MesJ